MFLSEMLKHKSLLLLFFTTIKNSSAQYPKSSKKQCAVHKTEFEGDVAWNPITHVGSKTLADCISSCKSHTDQHGRPCVAIEWSDKGNTLAETESRTCALAWGCDKIGGWGGGSVYYLDNPTDRANYQHTLKRQCFVHKGQYNGDQHHNPIWHVGTHTFDECMDLCETQVDQHGRRCVAIEWSDNGWKLPYSHKRTCALAWGCDYLRNWGGGSVYYRNIDSDVPSVTPSHMPSNAPSLGCIGEAMLSFSGKCTFDNLMNTLESHGCQDSESYVYVGADNAASARENVEALCDEAMSEAIKNFYDFKDISKKGYQFDREYMNGGSDWNSGLFNGITNDNNKVEADYTERIEHVQNEVYERNGISFPEYLYNFNTERSCDSKAVMCCFVSDHSVSGEGSCANSSGCHDADPLDNTDVCHVHVKNSHKASHTEYGHIFYNADAEGPTHCIGYTWTDDDPYDATNLYKGNLLFDISMRYGLLDNGYVRSIPHAPMCACADQMPTVTNAACRSIATAEHTWSFDPVNLRLKIWLSDATITYNDCNGQDLFTHYENVHGTPLQTIVSDCDTATTEYAADHAFVEKTQVKWIKVAGKGGYADVDDPLHTEVFHEGTRTHSSMSRTDFEAIWNESPYKIMLRRCQYCNASHRYIYYKYKHDTPLPENVDLLKIMKEYWYQFEGHYKHIDWDIYSTFDNALNDIEPWEFCNSNDANVGFPRDCGPYGRINNQWNTWQDPVHRRHYGQSTVAFYVAVPL